MQKGKLIIFSAPSGAGKTTIVKHLLKQDFGLEFSISATSRAPRHTETNGVDYYFLSPDEFQRKVKADEFLEWEEVYKGTCYGTLKSEVERIREQGKHVIFDVDVVGGLNIKKYYGKEALAVFVQPPSIEELRNRLVGRSTDSAEVIDKRVEKAQYELSFAPKFDLVLVSEELRVTLANAEKLVTDFINEK
ncbi:guanylate kinase [Mangrovibacterium marinum]|uniref:Guanylate kinase n=1 Tax=Mangrovibacterium marinum TaxID=1639118 RepID=A0A2T5C4X9_9BACT|nr:guanylate kinase [Mangrovibacterium marinum]PTN09928.1 guanylate kinase [Mangrovibacterium marinum]